VKRAAAVCLLACAWVAPEAQGAVRWGPPAHADAADAASPLDLRAVAFGQRDLHVVLRVRTAGDWATGSLRGGRSLCVVVDGRGRLCLAPGPQLRFAGVPIPARFSREDRRTLRARFAPRTIGLRRGRFAWHAETADGDAADRVPDAGTVAGRVSVLAQPRCFGAAARFCTNPRLAKVVRPRPAAAPLVPGSPCRPLPAAGACEFGVGRSAARATFALLGDSHAAQWRAALEVVAQARRRRGVAMTRAGCPFSVQIPASPDLGPSECRALQSRALAWLAAHPSVRTVFLSTWAQPADGPHGGAGYGGGPGHYAAMLDRLPRSVRRVVVLRDVPRTTTASITCVEARLRRSLPLAGACATPRTTAVTPDPLAAAARARRGARVIDLTDHFCDASRCFPVVGGAYVHRDVDHVNAIFAQTLGPFVLRGL
jgi:hypothetical protein